MMKMVHLSELLGNHRYCTKQHKRTTLAYITDELLHKCEHVDFLTSSTGQILIFIAHYIYPTILNYK